MMNTIYTNEEYMAQGFTREELPLIREFDEKHNREEFDNRYYELAKILGL